MAILNNLYPPIIDTYMPSFIINEQSVENKCLIYFSLSNYNSITDIKNAQITISDLNTNRSVLDFNKYPSEIKIGNIYEDINRKEDKYYIEIYDTDLKNGHFNIDEYYKVQIRFTGEKASNPPSGGIDSWLIENENYFSEWSTVCLIRGISLPTLGIRGFDDTADSIIWSSETLNIIGKLSFANINEDETLKFYKTTLYNTQNEILYESKNIYNNLNELNYTIPYLLIDGESYKIKIDYTTSNLYTDSVEYNFTVVINPLDKINLSIETEEDFNNGGISVNIKNTEPGFFADNFVIRRSSSLTNFMIWEDIHIFSVQGEKINIKWTDYTIESGIWYKYGVQRINNSGNRSVITIVDEPNMICFENIFLLADNKQLNIRFNPSISSFKEVIHESKIDTIGSKYPFFRRNGIIKYKEFPISGLITHFMNNDIFINEENLYKSNIDLYKDYNKKNNINDFYDINKERFFREEVMNFLYNNDVKLFRSSTEGNILVHLSDINFTPEERLGRMIYSFSCLATEVDICTIDNFNKYNIQNIGTISDNTIYKQDKFGELSEIIPANTNIIDILYNKYNMNISDAIVNIDYLKYLKIEINQPTYLITENNGSVVLADSDSTVKFPGYIVNINGNNIIIQKDGIYELKDEDTIITSITFPVDTMVKVSYIASLSYSENNNKINNLKYYRKVGQLWGSFIYKDSIYQRIWNKYYINNEKEIQYIFSLKNINIEAEKDTIIYANDLNGDYIQYIVGDTNNLFFANTDEIIKDFYFYGIHFIEYTEEDRQRLSPIGHKFINTKQTVDTLPDNPIDNGKYILNHNFNNLEEVLILLNRYDLLDNIKTNRILKQSIIDNTKNHNIIYYQQQWYLLDDNNNLICNTIGLIDYEYELAKGEYI